MVHFISVPALSYLFPIFPPREAHTQNSYLPFFLSVFISFYDIVICLEWPKLNHTFYPLSPSTTFFFPENFLLSLPPWSVLSILSLFFQFGLLLSGCTLSRRRHFPLCSVGVDSVSFPDCFPQFTEINLQVYP